MNPSGPGHDFFLKLFTAKKQTHRHRKQTYGYQSGERGREGQIRSVRLTDSS